MISALFLTYLCYAIIAILVASFLSRHFLLVAVILLISVLSYRGVLLGHLPLLGPHDTLLFFSLSLAGAGYLASQSKFVINVRWFRGIVGVISGLTMLGALFFKPLNMPLPQILDTLWFEIHVIVAFFGYALFVIGSLAGAAYISTHKKYYMDLLYKAVLTGWSFFSLSMISGGIWGYYAWGTYWLWTPKELWTSILWLYYALLLHVRYRGAGQEILTAWLAILGTFVMMFTYLGVSLLMKSSHSF